MSCVSIWNNRTLSTPDIVAIYNSGTPREYADLTTAEKVNLVSFWHLNEPSGTRYDAHGSNDLTDNNTVGVTTGPVEYVATENAAITKWENQAGNASLFADLTRGAATLSPILSSGNANWSNGNGLRAATGSLSQPHTLIGIVKDNSPISSSATIIDQYPASTRNILSRSSGTAYRIWASTSLVGSSVSNDRKVIIGEANSTSSVLYVDGTSVASGNAGANNFGPGLTVGSNATDGGQWAGDIEYIILLDRELTAAEITALGTL